MCSQFGVAPGRAGCQGAARSASGSSRWPARGKQAARSGLGQSLQARHARAFSCLGSVQGAGHSGYQHETFESTVSTTKLTLGSAAPPFRRSFVHGAAADGVLPLYQRDECKQHGEALLRSTISTITSFASTFTIGESTFTIKFAGKVAVEVEFFNDGAP